LYQFFALNFIIRKPLSQRRYYNLQIDRRGRAGMAGRVRSVSSDGLLEYEHGDLPGLILCYPKVFGDERGFFAETWHAQRYASIGIQSAFEQDNVSFSTRAVLRGLHFQYPNGQGKLVYALQGTVFDVALDIRVGSPTFGRWQGVTLSEENRMQLYVPPGFAHGFCVISDTAIVGYKCTAQYSPADEHTIRWDDPDIAVAWPEPAPRLSDKDAAAPALKDIPAGSLPRYAGDDPV
jgi:dTDP-4-dehydrorhamnose 3,5-epimerase